MVSAVVGHADPVAAGGRISGKRELAAERPDLVQRHPNRGEVLVARITDRDGERRVRAGNRVRGVVLVPDYALVGDGLAGPVDRPLGEQVTPGAGEVGGCADLQIPRRAAESPPSRSHPLAPFAADSHQVVAVRSPPVTFLVRNGEPRQAVGVGGGVLVGAERRLLHQGGPDCGGVERLSCVVVEGPDDEFAGRQLRDDRRIDDAEDDLLLVVERIAAAERPRRRGQEVVPLRQAVVPAEDGRVPARFIGQLLPDLLGPFAQRLGGGPERGVGPPVIDEAPAQQRLRLGIGEAEELEVHFAHTSDVVVQHLCAAGGEGREAGRRRERQIRPAPRLSRRE